MRYKRDREVIGKVKILGDSFPIRIEYNIDCDNEAEVYHADVATGDGVLDIAGSWLYTQEMNEQIDDIIWTYENYVAGYLHKNETGEENEKLN